MIRSMAPSAGVGVGKCTETDRARRLMMKSEAMRWRMSRQVAVGRVWG